MSTFTIDFFELAFLAEACIPPRPIARMGFWQDLTDKYWYEMTEGERKHLFEWLQRSPLYEESLAKVEDTQVFHARFDPDNQYMVQTFFNGVGEEHRAFKMHDKYYVNSNTHIQEEYIIATENFIAREKRALNK